MQIGILLLFVLGFNHPDRETMMEELTAGLTPDRDHFMEYQRKLYLFYCLFTGIHWILAQERRKFITDSEELAENDKLRAKMFRQSLYEQKRLEKNLIQEMEEDGELDFP